MAFSDIWTRTIGARGAPGSRKKEEYDKRSSFLLKVTYRS